MDIQKFKETLLEFLGDVTMIPDKNKKRFVKGDYSDFFKAPNGYMVLSPFVLVKVEESICKVELKPSIDKNDGDDKGVTLTVKPEPAVEAIESWVHFKLFTESRVYSVGAHWESGVARYLGCISNTRKPRVGEDWTRGHDLPDGYFCRETWESIKDRIIKSEMEPISKYIANGHYNNPQADEDIGPQIE